MDRFPPSGDTGQVTDRTPAVRAVVDALRRLADEIDAERQRADRAEASLSQVSEAFEDFRRSSDASMERLIREFRGYVCSTGDGQRALLDVTRQLLGSGPVCADADQFDDDRTAVEDLDAFGRFPRPNPDVAAVCEGGDGTAAEQVVADGEDTTDEHRIIDLQNEIDMRRLNASSYVQSLMARF